MATITRIDSPSSDLEQRLDRALSESSFFAKRHPLRLTAQSGHVTLHGTVDSYYKKQMAQEILRDVQGVVQIENRLEVAWPLDTTAAGRHDVCEFDSVAPVEPLRHDARGFEPTLTATDYEQGSDRHGTRRSRNLQGKSTHASR